MEGCVESLVETPIIDLSLLPHSRPLIINQIRQACQTYGFFHVINHGVGDSVIEEALNVNAQFFELPITAQKEELMSDDVHKTVRFGALKTGDYSREFLKLYANPIDDFISSWPRIPHDYSRRREAVSSSLGRAAPPLTKRRRAPYSPPRPASHRLTLSVAPASSRRSYRSQHRRRERPPSRRPTPSHPQPRRRVAPPSSHRGAKHRRAQSSAEPPPRRSPSTARLQQPSAVAVRIAAQLRSEHRRPLSSALRRHDAVEPKRAPPPPLFFDRSRSHRLFSFSVRNY